MWRIRFEVYVHIIRETEKPQYLLFHLKRRLRTEKLQISVPLPAMAVKIPPMKPVIVSTIACHTPKFGIDSNVLRLCCLKKTLLGPYLILNYKIVSFKKPVE